jgi:ribosomal protein S18 acetylase RimI-like enzyme
MLPVSHPLLLSAQVRPGGTSPADVGSGVMMQVRTATLDDVPIIVETAARSLDAEAMLRWSFGEERFAERIRRHFTHYDGENARRGWIRIVEDGVGIAVWIPPGARDEHEAIGAAPPGDEAQVLGEHAERHASFWDWVGDHEPSEPLRYLSHIAVAPERQGEGLGSMLMRDGLRAADRDGVAAWLETSKAENATYYERFGFLTVVQEDAPQGGPHIWFMRRQPTAPERPS